MGSETNIVSIKEKKKEKRKGEERERFKLAVRQITALVLWFNNNLTPKAAGSHRLAR